jgi:hypothetical protein
MTLELISQIIQGFIGFLMAYFAYDFLQEFKKLRSDVNEFHVTIASVIQKVEYVEDDHGRRLTRLEEKIL